MSHLAEKEALGLGASKKWASAPELLLSELVRRENVELEALEDVRDNV